MDILTFVALVLAIVTGVWAATSRAWPLLCLAIAVVLLCLTGVADLHLN